MSDYARNLDTFMDGDDGPDWFPEMGERVAVEHSGIAYTGAPNNLIYTGKIVGIDHDQEETEYLIRMDNNPFGDRPWFVTAVIEDLAPEDDE